MFVAHDHDVTSLDSVGKEYRRGGFCRLPCFVCYSVKSGFVPLSSALFM